MATVTRGREEADVAGTGWLGLAPRLTWGAGLLEE